ncbi:MAG: histone deacetylase [Planctomycetota bacterium]|nr:histone deacetylase [Planctomycetota bacterium]
MGKTGIVYDDIYLAHETGFHPENRERLRRTVSHLKATKLWDKLSLLKPRKATVEEVALVHSRNYIKSVERICAQGGGHLDADTVTSPSSYEAALYAVGGILDACDSVIRQQTVNCFCLVRPPGHHALPERAMGFCLFNNVAIAARYLQEKHSIKRVAIIDWDVHHGNGTEEIFYRDGSVFYFSIHRYPFYPGTGAADERGEGEGEGTTLNIPFSGWEGREVVLSKFEQAVLKDVAEFAPDFVLISAGFDAYERDPIGGLGLLIEDYRKMTDIVCALAQKTAKRRVISALEGGYSLEGLPLMVAQHLEGLLSASFE